MGIFDELGIDRPDWLPLHPIFYMLTPDKKVVCAVLPQGLMDWRKFMRNQDDLIVCKETICGVEISTVFLPAGAPSIITADGFLDCYYFETMLFAGDAYLIDRAIKIGGADYQRRYDSYDKAMMGHIHMVKCVNAAFRERN